LRDARVRVETQFADHTPLVQGSAGKLQQVFLNLFLNAKDAMPGGGVLRISTETHEAAVRVEVSDTGHGIAREHITRIYDPFFTTKTARAGNGGGNGEANRDAATLRSGTGLGLSVTYGIIQEHAGKIRVESAAGQGTSFHLEFPRVRRAVSV